jgi:enoyl-CoA hydratase/carnithine racemase
VVVAGAGRAFCAGFDLGDFSAPDAELSAWEAADLGRTMAEAVTSLRALTLAAIHGHCVGGGLVLAAACDLRLAAEDARFSIPEADLGIPLAWGGIPRLVRELGPALTKELVLTCRPFDAAEARALRFVNRVVPADRLEAEAAALAAELAARPGLVLAATKRHTNAAAEEMASTAHAHADAHALVSALQDPESRAAGRAYLERRRRPGPR